MPHAHSSEAFQLDSIEIFTCLRKARRGAAADQSGITSDHLFRVLENESDSDLLRKFASLLAVGQVPDSILEAVLLGRMTVLSKPDGWVRGIAVGDNFRRLMARTISMQMVEAATAPIQCALPTKAGCECVAHILQTLTDLDPETTMTIDGMGGTI